MNILLGGALTCDRVYEKYGDYIIETYQDIDMSNIEHYKELSEQIYKKHFKNKFYDIVIGHSMGGLIIIDILIKNYQIDCNKIVITESYLFEPNEEFRNIVHGNQTLEVRLNNVMKSEMKKYNPNIFESLRKLNIVGELKSISIPLDFVYGMRGMDYETFIQKLDFPNLDNIHLIGIPNSSHFCLIENQSCFLNKVKK